MHTINVVLASMGIAFLFTFVMDMVNAISYYLEGRKQSVCLSKLLVGVNIKIKIHIPIECIR